MTIHIQTRLTCDGRSQEHTCTAIAGTFEDRGETFERVIVPLRSLDLREQARRDGWRRESRTVPVGAWPMGLPDSETNYMVDLCPSCVAGMALVSP